MSNAQVWSGISQGLSKTADYMSKKNLREANLAEANARRQKAELELSEYSSNAPLRQKRNEVELQRLGEYYSQAPNRQRRNDLELQQLEATTRNINQQSTKQQTYDSFRRFESDKDVRHLNTWLNDVKRNPVGANLYGDVVRIDKLTKTTENDELLRKMGFTNLEEVYQDPELSEDLVIFTGTDKRGIVNMNDMYAGTGFSNYLTNEQLNTMERKARVSNMMRSGESKHKVTMKERVVQDLIDTGKASNVSEAYQILKDMESSNKGKNVLSSVEERAVERIMNEENINYIDALDKYYSVRKRDSSKQKPTSVEERAIERIMSNEGIDYVDALDKYYSVRRRDSSKIKAPPTSTEERAIERIIQDENISYLEALNTYYSAKKQGSSETNESRFIERYMNNNPDSSYEEAASEYKNLSKTRTQKEVSDVREIRKELDNIEWLETDISNLTPSNRNRIYRDYISPLEDLRGLSLSTEDKRIVRNLRDLTSLGATAGTELTEEETGLLDNTLNNVRKYMFNEVGGKRATSSYETFRNVFRNSLYGASLTQSEISAFNKAAGTLGQKLKPVLSQLQVQMETIKNNLEAIRDLNDPDIAHYYLGIPVEDIDRAIEAIDERLNDPRLAIGKQEIKVKKQSEPVIDKASFDFDKAMKESGL